MRAIAKSVPPVKFRKMGHLPTLMRLKPGTSAFVTVKNLGHRGEALTFRPNISNDCFSTDHAGFRHSVFAGDTLGLRDIVQRERYGIVLGSSNIFGIGTRGNENTLASLLGERFGFPFANISLPEGTSRNLHSQFSSVLWKVPHPPAVVIHFTGGDFTAFCFSGFADAVYGPPNLKQYPTILAERGSPPNADDYFKPLLAFTTMWTQAIVATCRSRKIPIIIGNDTTFFEKRKPSQMDLECKLGTPFNPNQERWFPNHKKFIAAYYAHREALAAKLGVPIAGPGSSNDYSFFDEFHYDADGTRSLFESIAPSVETLLSGQRASAA